MRAHQPTKQEDEPDEFQKYLDKINTEEFCANTTGGMHEWTEQTDLVVYLKTISGKTISVTGDTRQTTKEIKDDIERRTKVLRKQQCLVSQ